MRKGHIVQITVYLPIEDEKEARQRADMLQNHLNVNDETFELMSGEELDDWVYAQGFAEFREENIEACQMLFNDDGECEGIY